MHRYVIKRLLMMIPVIIGVSFLVFFIMDMAPGDAVDLMAPEGATAQDLAAIRHDLGLDKPVVLRYIDYMLGMLQGDMGVSYVSKTDVFSTYMQKLPATLILSFASIFVSIILSVPLGIYSATKQGSIQDNISMVLGDHWFVYAELLAGTFADHRVFPSPSLVPVRRRSDLVSNRTSCYYDWHGTYGNTYQNHKIIHAGCLKTGVFKNSARKRNSGENCCHVPCASECVDSDYHDHGNTACRRTGR